MSSEALVVVDHIRETSEAVVVGIDEAGRGPVIGPMVYAVCILPCNAVTSYRDSKVLSPRQRRLLFQEIGSYAYVAVSPEYISAHMLVEKLNTIARRAVCKLLQAAGRKCSSVKAVYVDALGDNSTYCKFLESRFPFSFVVENKADSKYQVVSGASIVAKVTRDAFVEPLDCGSGYPGDPKTKAWLKGHLDPVFGFPKQVRHSWATAKAMLPSKRSRRLGGSLEGFYSGPD